jgi:hypothetical protein
MTQNEQDIITVLEWLCLVSPQFSTHRKRLTLQSVNLGVSEKLGVKLIACCFANTFCNFFVIE